MSSGLQDAIEAMRCNDQDWLVANGWLRERNGVRTMTQKLCDEAGRIPHAETWLVVISALAREETASTPASCNCRTTCGDDGDPEGPGTCKGLPRPKPEPLVEIILVDRRTIRDDVRYHGGDPDAVYP